MNVINMDDLTQDIDLPGFRFHPTEEELLDFYLKNIIFGKNLRYDIIGCLNIYKYNPEDLPGMAKIGEREWYFFVPRDRKHGGGGRPNRTTEIGFWKATGSDRKVMSLSDPRRTLGLRKTLVFYKGRAPRGQKTDWVMNEYRLPDNWCLPKDIVLCKIYRKATSLKVLEQRAAMEEEMKTVDASPSSSPLSSMDTTFCCPQEDSIMPQMSMQYHHDIFKKELGNIKAENTNEIITGSSMVSPIRGKDKLPEIHVPKFSIDWNQDGFSLNSPWLQNLMTPYTNILNF